VQLEIEGASDTDKGLYKLVAKNEKGEAQSSEVEVTEIPEPEEEKKKDEKPKGEKPKIAAGLAAVVSTKNGKRSLFR
jgi:hypothetical protein